MISTPKKKIAPEKKGLNECYCSYIERITTPYRLHHLNHSTTKEELNIEGTRFSKEHEIGSNTDYSPFRSSYSTENSWKRKSGQSFNFKQIYASAMREIDCHEKWVSSIIDFRNANTTKAIIVNEFRG